jgi:beta-glucanase (GH16 family)
VNICEIEDLSGRARLTQPPVKISPFPFFRAVFLSGLFFAAAMSGFAATPTLIWSDDFNQTDGTGPDPAKWSYDLGGGGWGNEELETYTNSRTNSYVVSDPGALDGKALVIAAVKDSSGNYTSARLKTETAFSTTYGHFEARLKTTSGQGLWPAFWMLGTDITTVSWPQCGEIDIMETINAATTLYGTLHGPGYSGANGIGSQVPLSGGENYSHAYHVYAVDWAPNQIQWSVDGTVYQTVAPSGGPAGTLNIPPGDEWVFNNSPFFILLNLAVGGDFPGSPSSATVFPGLYVIDYVRVYGLPPTAPTAGAANAMTPNQINLSWVAPSDLKGFTLTGYNVMRATNSSLTQNTLTFNVGASAPFADTTVSGGVTYYYTVAAVTTGGISDPSAVFSATTPVPTPAIATPPVGQTLNPGSTLVLTAVAPLGTSYEWFFNGSTTPLADSSAGATADIISGATGPQLVIAHATAMSAGSYTVVAINSAGSSTPSAPAVVSVSQSSDPGLATSISTRAFVGTGDDILIGGFYIVGSTSRTVLVQGLGPALGPLGVASALQHPDLSIHQTQNGHDVTLYSNTGWGSSQVLLNAAASVFASPVLSQGSADSELLLTLPPGGYSAEVSGADGGTGVALCAIYELP